jgi:hypothetical protein
VAHLGPQLLAPLDHRLLADAWPLHPAEQVAFVSRQIHLRAGDVVGLCPSFRRSVAFNERVELQLGKMLRLEGWATAAPPACDWRL